MTDELIQRLRVADADTKAIFGEDFVSTQGEAVDEIERLRAEVATVRTDAHDALCDERAARERAESALAALRKRVEEANRLLSLACLGLDVEGPQHRTIVRIQRLLLD